MIDLEEVASRIQDVGDDGDIDVAHDLVTLTLPKLVTELRAAREVIATLRIYDEGPMELPAPIASVLAVYDQAAGS